MSPGGCAIKKGSQRLECRRIERIADAWTLDFADDQSGFLQDSQVLRRRGGGETDLFHNVAADAGRPPQQSLDDLDARRVGQRLCELGDPLLVALGRSRLSPDAV